MVAAVYTQALRAGVYGFGVWGVVCISCVELLSLSI